MRTAKKLLDRLTEKYPPPKGAKHAVVSHDGKLMVVLAHGDPIAEVAAFKHFTLEDEDLDRPDQALFKDIVSLMTAQQKKD